MRNKVDDFGNMKLSVMQENDESNREKPSENRLSDDEIMMDNVTNDKNTDDSDTLASEEGSMVSNLPLLFANGFPTSLEKITMVQLECFISFMIHCSLGHNNTKIIDQPQWWPQDVKFSNPLMRPKKINDNWMANLKKLVFRCYTYHRSEYLLRFCSYLAQYPCEDLQYVNNWDSTTSLYHKSTGKLLVTFRNENLYYDRKNDYSRRTLLSHNASSSSYGNKARQQQTSMMVQPPCDDIYLCDNCDAEFVGLTKMKEHEKICCEHDGSGSRSSTPDLSTVEPELQQDQFLEYFHLFSNKTEVKSVTANNANVSDNSIVRRPPRRVRNAINFARCTTIPFSSPAGMLLAKKSKAMTEETQQERLDRIERHIIAPALNNSCRPKWLDAETHYVRWIVTYKQHRDKLTIDNYAHQYKFPNFRNKPVLSLRSQLLYVACRPIYVALTKLDEKQVNELKKNPSKYLFTRKNINTQKILLMRKSGPACKTKPKKVDYYEQNALAVLKRKAPLGNEFDPIIVEDEATNINTLTANPTEVLSNDVKSCCIDNAKTINERKSPSSMITLIDLCSSDEEGDNLRVQTTCDENKDPMNSAESLNNKSLLQKFMPKQALCEALHLSRTFMDELVIKQSSEQR